MRITFIINDLTVGGAQRLFIELANRLAKRGHAVRLLALSVVPEKLDLASEIDDSVEWKRLSFTRVTSVKGWRNLQAFLNEREDDVVFTTLFFSNSVTRLISFFNRRRRRIIVVEQNTYIDKPKRFIALDRFLSHWTNIIVCTSDSVADFTSHQEKIPRRKFVVIHSGVDVLGLREKSKEETRVDIRTEFNIPIDATLFLSVARLTEQKDHILMIKSFKLLRDQCPERNLRLLIVGEGKLLDELVHLVKEIRLSDWVTFAGARYDVHRFYSSADYFISTSIIEGFSLVHAEAMTFGLPIVTTRTAGPDVMVLHGRTGFFVEHTVPSVVSGCIALMEADYSLLSGNTYERASEFSIENTVEKYESLARSVVTKG